MNNSIARKLGEVKHHLSAHLQKIAEAVTRPSSSQKWQVIHSDLTTSGLSVRDAVEALSLCLLGSVVHESQCKESYSVTDANESKSMCQTIGNDVISRAIMIAQVRVSKTANVSSHRSNLRWLDEILATAKQEFSSSDVNKEIDVALLPKTPSAKRRVKSIKRQSRRSSAIDPSSLARPMRSQRKAAMKAKLRLTSLTAFEASPDDKKPAAKATKKHSVVDGPAQGPTVERSRCPSVTSSVTSACSPKLTKKAAVPKKIDRFSMLAHVKDKVCAFESLNSSDESSSSVEVKPKTPLDSSVSQLPECSNVIGKKEVCSEQLRAVTPQGGVHNSSGDNQSPSHNDEHGHGHNDDTLTEVEDGPSQPQSVEIPVAAGFMSTDQKEAIVSEFVGLWASPSKDAIDGPEEGPSFCETAAVSTSITPALDILTPERRVIDEKDEGTLVKRSVEIQNVSIEKAESPVLKPASQTVEMQCRAEATTGRMTRTKTRTGPAQTAPVIAQIEAACPALEAKTAGTTVQMNVIEVEGSQETTENKRVTRSKIRSKPELSQPSYSVLEESGRPMSKSPPVVDISPSDDQVFLPDNQLSPQNDDQVDLNLSTIKRKMNTKSAVQSKRLRTSSSSSQMFSYTRKLSKGNVSSTPDMMRSNSFVRAIMNKPRTSPQSAAPLSRTLTSFISRATPSKTASRQELAEEKSKRLQEKMLAESQRLKEAERERIEQMEVRKLQREERLKKAAEVREAQHLNKQKQVEQKVLQKVDILGQVLEKKQREEKEKALAREQKLQEAEERRKREEEARLKKMKMQELEAQRTAEALARKKELEEQARKNAEQQQKLEVERQRLVEKAKTEALRKVTEQRLLQGKTATPLSVHQSASKTIYNSDNQKHRQQEASDESLVMKNNTIYTNTAAAMPLAHQVNNHSQLNKTFDRAGDMPYMDLRELEEEDEFDDPKFKTKVKPAWCLGDKLRAAIINQEYHPINLAELFGHLIEGPELSRIFVVPKARFFKRTSSAIWNSPPIKKIK